MTGFTRVITASGKVYKLRDGAVCRNCKSDLTIENWSVGNGNVCKTCMKEYNRARRKGVWSW